MKPVVVRRIARADGETVRLLGELGVATVSEAQGRWASCARICGPYTTARACREAQ